MRNGEVTLDNLKEKQAIVLASLYLYPTDTEAINDLGWSRDTFYRYKKEVAHLKEEMVREIVIETQASLALAGRFAVCKLLELLEADELVQAAREIVDSFNFNDKFKAIQDIIGNVVIKERRQVEVWAHIPLQALTTEKLGHEPISRDCWTTKCGKVDAF